MAEITARRAGEMVRGLFEILAEEPNGLLAKEALARLEKRLPPSAFENAHYHRHPYIRRYVQLVRFHSINEMKAGWMTKRDGRWALTDTGRAALAEWKDPEQFHRQAVKLYRQWRGLQGVGQAVAAGIPDTGASPELKPPATPVGEVPLAVPPESEPEEIARKIPAHREMQWLLGKLGNDLGLSVWLPPGDRGLDYQGNQFASLQLGELPLMFSQKALRTVRQIDVIWLGDSSIEAAFEIESTTSIYSGILRLADLIALMPGISIPLYIVAPDERRRKVFGEVTRPTFGKLSPPMQSLCRYISFSALRTRLPSDEHRRFMKPQFIRTLSEECVPEQS